MIYVLSQCMTGKMASTYLFLRTELEVGTNMEGAAALECTWDFVQFSMC